MKCSRAYQDLRAFLVTMATRAVMEFQETQDDQDRWGRLEFQGKIRNMENLENQD